MREEERLASEILGEGPRRDSLAKQLFFGNLYPIHIQEPNFEEADGVVASLRAFASEHIDADAIDREAKIPQNVIEGLAKLGILGLTVPQEFGGLGKSQYCYCRVMEELALWDGSTAILVNAHQSIGMKGITLFGTETQKKRFLPELARGEELAAFSLTEPNAGSDAGGIETVATFDEKRGLYILNGEKQWTTNGSISKIWTVMAKLEGKVSAFIVESNSPGIKILDPAQEKVGIRGTQTTNIRFSNVLVPQDQLLGAKGEGLKVCLTSLDYGRTTFGATCTGIAKDLLERAREYAKKRVQFGKPLIEFQMIQEKLARIAAYTEAMEATTYLTAGLIDAGQEDVMLEAAMLKVFASEALWEIIYETMQIYGGRSFFTNEPLERLMRDARLNMIGEGANEVLRQFIAAVGLREVGNSLKEASTFAKVGHLLKLKREKDLFRFKRAVDGLLLRYKEEVIERQLDLNRITDAAIALFTVIAVKRSKMTKAKAYYCQLAMKRFDIALRSLGDPLDSSAKEVAYGS